MHATRAAVQEGIVPGGGTALLMSVTSLEGLKTENHDQKVGVDIVARSLSAPIKQIAENAGFDGGVVAGKVTEKAEKNFGFNAQTGEYTDLVSAGIIDPAKVTRCALQDAASIAGLLITTEAMVADVPEEGAPAMPPMPAGGMGGMGGMM